MHHARDAGASGELSELRQEYYQCLTRRTDALFELTDAVLCTDGPVPSIAELSLTGEHRRGHGSGYAALARGRVDIDRLRTALTAVSLPRAADGRLVLAVDVTCWLRPEAHTCPQRILRHTYGRGKDQHMMVPGWPYSIVVALETGRHSWTAPLDAVRLAPGDDAASVTARQIRDVVSRLIAAGQWKQGDPEIMVVLDAGYDAPRIAYLLADLPVRVLGRMRSDRVLRRPTPPRPSGTRGRPCRHGGEFVFGDRATWGEPEITIETSTRLYGPALVRAWDRLHRGSTYTAFRFTERLADNGILPSMGSVGDSYDNALMENFFSTLKIELVYRRSWRTRDEAENDLFRYIDGFYNTERIQKDLGWLSPDEYEAAWHTAQARPATIPAAPTASR
ncbi:transposase [Saccharothrix sp. CB00851]|uniref:transposase n=1 Tax=Saccharothrix sp. CB00851 TaxID=1835005 RepID=UPI000B27985D|nr:transposase [Saccharothrix sp. CB00851]